MIPTHAKKIPDTQESGESPSLCLGFAYCARCRADAAVWYSVSSGMSNGQIAEDAKRVLGATWEELQIFFREAFVDGLISAQRAVEISEYIDERIKNS